jgi:hypothetical protein
MATLAASWILDLHGGKRNEHHHWQQAIDQKE